MIDPPLFPAGEFDLQDFSSEIMELADQFQSLPRLVQESVDGMNDAQLNTKYRNWTVRQIVHHLADSHTNCYIRIHWALTESTPEIKSYDETAWSKLQETVSIPLASSLQMLNGIHTRLASLFKILDDEQLRRGFFHPEIQSVVPICEVIPNYIWHTKHHVAQIEWVKKNRF